MSSHDAFLFEFMSYFLVRRLHFQRTLTTLPPLPPGHSRSLRSQRRSLPPAGGGAAEDGGRARLQRDGRQRAELPHIHLPHHSRRRRGEARRPETRGPAPVCQRCGRCNQSVRKERIIDWRESVEKPAAAKYVNSSEVFLAAFHKLFDSCIDM